MQKLELVVREYLVLYVKKQFKRCHCCRHWLQGNITVELYWSHAPKTCRNFAELVCVTVLSSGVCVTPKH